MSETRFKPIVIGLFALAGFAGHALISSTLSQSTPSGDPPMILFTPVTLLMGFYILTRWRTALRAIVTVAWLLLAVLMAMWAGEDTGRAALAALLQAAEAGLMVAAVRYLHERLAVWNGCTAIASYGAACVVVPIATAAVAGAFALQDLGGRDLLGPVHAGLTWYLMHATAFVCLGLGVAAMFGLQGPWALPWRETRNLTLVGGVAAFALQTVLVITVFYGQDRYPLPVAGHHHPWTMVLLTPVLLLSAFRFGVGPTMLLGGWTSILVILLTREGHGPFAVGGGMSGRLDLLMLLLISGACLLLVVAFAERLREAVEAAESAIADKSRFIASIGHEMKSSLNGMIGAAELLERELAPGSDPNDRLGLIKRSGTLMTRLVEDTLNYATEGRQTFQLSEVAFSLADLMQDVAQIFRSRILNPDIEFCLDIAEVEGLLLNGDGPRIRQVVINLLSNACKFTQKGSIRMTARARPLSGARFVCQIEVADTGIGVPDGKKPDIFNVFTRSSQADGGGLGLGLAISRDIAAAMDGDLVVYDNPGGGAVFCFKFVAESTAAKPEDMHAIRLEGTTGRSVLLAEDNQASRTVLEAMLKAAGLEVTTVADGAQAVQAAGLKGFDIILLDSCMPNMTGPEAIAAIRTLDGVNSRTPIVIVSGDDSPDDNRRFVALGAHALVPKPVSAEALFSAIQGALRGETAGAGSSVIDRKVQSS